MGERRKLEIEGTRIERWGRGLNLDIYLYASGSSKGLLQRCVVIACQVGYSRLRLRLRLAIPILKSNFC